MAAPMWKSLSMLRISVCGKFLNQNRGTTWSRKVYFMHKCQMSSANHDPSETDHQRTTFNEMPGYFDEDDFELERMVRATPREHLENIDRDPDQPEDARILKLAVIGIPNAGKSTLINRLMGLKVSSVSSKVHTTRRNTNAVFTEDNKQIVFVDTPGLINASSRKKHHVEKTLVYNPELGVQAADLIAVIVDAADKWTRDFLDKKVLQVLTLHKDKPAILILNKVDAMKSKIMLLHITRLLTEGIVAGKKIEFSTKMLKAEKKNFDVKAYLRKIDETIALGDEIDDQPAGVKVTKNNQNFKTPVISLKEIQEKKQEKLDNSHEVEPRKIDNVRWSTHQQRDMQREHNLYLDYLSRMKEVSISVRDKTGWPHFDKVFMISALENDGIIDLKKYLLGKTQPGDWVYHSSVMVDQNPMNLAKEIVWEKLLEHLPKSYIPYQLSPEIVLWEVDEEDTLKIIIDVKVNDEFQFKRIIGSSNMRAITHEAKQELLNAFRCEIRFKLQIKLGFTKKKMPSRPKQL